MSTEDFQTINAMRQYGGHFAKSLSLTFIKGDDENKQRLKAAFPELFLKYAEMAKRKEQG